MTITSDKVVSNCIEIKNKIPMLLDKKACTDNTGKQAVYIIHVICHSACAPSTLLTAAGNSTASTITWRDIAYGILKHITQKEPDMEFFLPSIGSKVVSSCDSAMAVARSVLVFVQQKEAQEMSFIEKFRRFISLKPKPLLPLDPPALPHGALPAEDIRPAWYTANYIANILTGNRIESSSDGWEPYMLTKNLNYIKEMRDKDSIIRK